MSYTDPWPYFGHESLRKELQRRMTMIDTAISGVGGGGGSVYSFMKRSSTSTSTAAPTLLVPWQTEEATLGSDVTWSSDNNTRLTVATTGTYKIGGYLTYSSAGQRTQACAQILINGTWEGDFRGDTYVRNSGSSWDYGIIEISSEPFNLTANDYVELQLARTSGANTSYNTGGSNTVTFSGAHSRIWVERVA